MAQYFLSEADVKVLKEVVRQVTRNPSGPYGRPAPTEEDHQASDVYVAMVPVGGIPAASDTTPGSAECTIYRISEGVLEAIEGLDRTVYNIGIDAIPEGVGTASLGWILIAKDKHGSWIAVPVGAGAASTITSTNLGFPVPGDLTAPDVASFTNIEWDYTQGVYFADGSDANSIFVKGYPASGSNIGMVDLLDQELGLGVKTIHGVEVTDVSGGFSTTLIVDDTTGSLVISPQGGSSNVIFMPGLIGLLADVSDVTGSSISGGNGILIPQGPNRIELQANGSLSSHGCGVVVTDSPLLSQYGYWAGFEVPGPPEEGITTSNNVLRTNGGIVVEMADQVFAYLE